MIMEAIYAMSRYPTDRFEEDRRFYLQRLQRLPSFLIFCSSYSSQYIVLELREHFCLPLRPCVNMT